MDVYYCAYKRGQKQAYGVKTPNLQAFVLKNKAIKNRNRF